MDYTHYMFASFVFLLVCAAIFINNRLKKTRETEPQKDDREQIKTDRERVEQDSYRREEQLMTLYRNLEDAMRSMEEEIQEAREEISRQREEAASMLESMEQLSAGIRGDMTRRGRGRPKSAGKETTNGITVSPERKKPGPKKKSTSDKVRDLHKAGLNADQIAQELTISRGEVDLVLGLNKD